MLSKMAPPVFPVALGVIRAVTDFTYESRMEQIIASEKETSPIKCMDDLMNSGKTWDI
jgi:hypothetical protein